MSDWTSAAHAFGNIYFLLSQITTLISFYRRKQCCYFERPSEVQLSSRENLTVVLLLRPLSQTRSVSIVASSLWHLTSFPENCSRGWMPRSRMSRSRSLNWVQSGPSRPHPKDVATRPPSCQPNWPADLTSMRATPLRDSTASSTLTRSLRNSPVNRLKTWRRCSKGETCLLAVVGMGIGNPEIKARLLTWWRWLSVWSTQAHRPGLWALIYTACVSWPGQEGLNWQAVLVQQV